MNGLGVQVFPEKCCATCGFLYGLTSAAAKAIDRENAMFDPDLMRTPGYQTTSNAKPPGRDSSLPYKPHVSGTEPEKVTWDHVGAFCCYQLEFEEISVSKSSGALAPGGSEDVNPVIHKDRADCSGYFPYHRGFTARQHVELMLEEQRIKRQEQHAESISQLQAKYAKRLNFAPWALVIVTTVLVVVTLYDNWPDILGWIVSFVS